MQIKERITLFQKEFNIHFEKKICKILQEQQDFHSLETQLDTSLAQIILSYANGGKRIRPFLISYFAEKDLENQEVLNLCIASELFHLAAIIHDDIMDASDMRRGVPTIHTAIAEYQQENSHLGNDLALLLGDMFLTSALATAALLPSEIFEIFRKMIQRTIRGQYLDSLGMNQKFGETPEKDVIARHNLKTAYYTFITPAELGYTLSEHNNEKNMKVLTAIMTQLGLLYQIRDDIIDCVDENSGKALFGDIFENQTTWVSLYIKEKFPNEFTNIINAKDNNDKDTIKNIFTRIDLIAPYQREFTKCLESIQNIEPQYNSIKEKALNVLNLLILN